jgi:prepilin-type processing-associated H-X9-DG protein
MNANGSNYLFMDGHVQWYSAIQAGERLECFQKRRDGRPQSGPCMNKYPYNN